MTIYRTSSIKGILEHIKVAFSNDLFTFPCSFILLIVLIVPSLAKLSLTAKPILSDPRFEQIVQYITYLLVAPTLGIPVYGRDWVIFFQGRYVEDIVNRGQLEWKCYGSHSFQNFQWINISGLNFSFLPNLVIPFNGETFRNTLSPFSNS